MVASIIGVLCHKKIHRQFPAPNQAFVADGKYSVVNNIHEPQNATVYTASGSCDLHLEANEICWYNL